MIAAHVERASALAARLAAKAGRLGAARIETRRREADPGRWRLARLLWPLFAGE